MKVIVATSDPVLASFVETLLTDAAIAYHVADRHIASVEALIAAFPMRIMVGIDDVAAAVAVLRDAGLDEALVAGG